MSHASPPAKSFALAMPLFSTTHPPSPAAITNAWEKLAPNGPRMKVVRADEKGFEVHVDDRAVLGIHIGVPVPNNEALETVRSSWMWQEPDTAVRTHASHAIVTARSGDAINDAWDVARVSAAMLAAGTGVALYWGNSRQVHPLRVATAFGASDKLPVPLFVGVTISAESASGPYAAATHGLESLGHKEFEIRKTRATIGSIRSTLLDLAAYVLKSGPVLLHGQTMGPSANVKWTITHEPSTLVPGRDVIVIGMP